jgi:hypothetical protein
MIIANIETFPLRIPFKSGTQAAASEIFWKIHTGKRVHRVAN